MPGFLYPLFLLGAAAAAIPVLLHLFRNEQAPELRFSAVRLLQGVRVEHAERRRIRDWLLLALRAAALLLLALAFARPYLPARQVAGAAGTVLLVDRSASMTLGGAWSQARAAAIAEIDRTGTDEALALVSFDDRPRVIVQPTFDRAAVRAALDRLQPGVGGTRYRPALARAVSLLDEADARTGRVVLITDLQGTPADARATVPDSIRVDVRATSASAPNISVLGARRGAGGVVATLRNGGAAAARVRVRLESGGRTLVEVPVDLPPWQIVEAPLRAAEAGTDLRVALAEPDPGGFTADDARYLDAGATPRTRILIVSPPGDRFYLDAALQAADDASEFDVRTATGESTLAAIVRQPPPEVVFLVGPRGLDRAGRDALVRYVRGGGHVFIGASDALNEPGFAAFLEGLIVAAPHADDAVLNVAAVEARHPLFRRLGPMAGAMGAASFTQTWRIRATGWDVLARFNDGAAALLERTLGAGRIVVFASDLNRRWNDLPLQSAFVPFIHEITRYLAPERSPGEYTPATLPETVEARLGPLTLESGRRVVVNPDPRESDSARMDASQFSTAIRHRGGRRLDPSAMRHRAEATEQRQSLWRYGLMLMFATLAVEGFVGARLTGRIAAQRLSGSPVIARGRVQ